MIPVEDGTTLPLLYHLNSEPWMNLEAYAQHSYEVEFKREAGEALPLPAPGAGSIGCVHSRPVDPAVNMRSARCHWKLSARCWAEPMD